MNRTSEGQYHYCWQPLRFSLICEKMVSRKLPDRSREMTSLYNTDISSKKVLVYSPFEMRVLSIICKWLLNRHRPKKILKFLHLIFLCIHSNVMKIPELFTMMEFSMKILYKISFLSQIDQSRNERTHKSE